jgi:hypothetical protein
MKSTRTLILLVAVVTIVAVCIVQAQWQQPGPNSGDTLTLQSQQDGRVPVHAYEWRHREGHRFVVFISRYGIAALPLEGGGHRPDPWRPIGDPRQSDAPRQFGDPRPPLTQPEPNDDGRFGDPHDRGEDNQR